MKTMNAIAGPDHFKALIPPTKVKTAIKAINMVIRSKVKLTRKDARTRTSVATIKSPAANHNSLLLGAVNGFARKRIKNAAKIGIR